MDSYENRHRFVSFIIKTSSEKKQKTPVPIKGQEFISCGTTQVDDKNHPLCPAQIMQAALITGAVPVGYYLLTLSAALISPFTMISAAAISPAAALWE